MEQLDGLQMHRVIGLVPGNLTQTRRDGSWRIMVTIGGKQVRKVVPGTRGLSKWLAYTQLGPLLAKLAEQASSHIPNSSRISDWWEQYLEIRRPDWQAGTRKAYGLTRKRVLHHWPAGTKLIDIKRAQVQDWLGAMRNSGLAAASANGHLRNARSWMAEGIAHYDLEVANPFSRVRRLREPVADHVYVTPEQAERMCDAAPDPQMAAMIALARYGGLRYQEIRRLERVDIHDDAEAPYLIIREAKGEDGLRYRDTKNRMRQVPVRGPLRVRCCAFFCARGGAQRSCAPGPMGIAAPAWAGA